MFIKFKPKTIVAGILAPSALVPLFPPIMPAFFLLRNYAMVFEILNWMQMSYMPYYTEKGEMQAEKGKYFYGQWKEMKENEMKWNLC